MSSVKQSIVAIAIAFASTFALGADYDKSIDVQMPDRIAQLEFVGKTEFQEGGPSVSYGYQRKNGFVRGAVFVYTGGFSSISPDLNSPVVQKHFDTALRAVKMMESMGKVKSITFSPEPTRTTQYPGCGPQFLWRGYEINLDGTTRFNAFTYLTVVRNNFVKLRITLNRQTEQDQKDAEAFVVELRKVLGNCK